MKNLYVITFFCIIAGMSLHAADPEQQLIDFIKRNIAGVSEDSIRKCLNQNDVNTPLFNGQGLVHFAAGLGSVDVMQMLYDKGADINLQNSLDYTPLHSAATFGRLEAVTFLLTHGADSSKRNFLKATPAEVARNHGNVIVAEFIDNYEHIEDIKEPELP